MAYIDPSQDPDDQQQNNPTQADESLGSNSAQSQNQTPAQPSTGGAGGGANAGAPGGGAGAAPGSGNNSAPQSSGTSVTGNTQATPAQQNANSGWTNLDSYLNANQDQATQIGQQIAGSVNQAGTQAQQDIGNLNTGFDAAVNQNTTQQNNQAVNQAVSDAGSLTAGQNLSSQDENAFQQQAGASYAGPTDVTSFGGYNQAQQDISNATQEAQETQSEAGRGTLLNQQYQNTSPTGYTAGENNLDQMLLQNSAGGQAALQPLEGQWSGLNSALGNAVSTGDAQAQAAAATDQATAANAENALNTATGNFQNNLNTGLAGLETTDQNAWNNLETEINGGQLTPDVAAALGINTTDQNVNSGHDYLAPNSLGTYFTPAATPTLASYASADQYAQAAALAELAGQPGSSILQPGTIAQAGTAQSAPAYSTNVGQYNSDNAAAQAEYKSQVSNAMKQIGNLPINGLGGTGTISSGLFGNGSTFQSPQDAINWANGILTGGGKDLGAAGGWNTSEVAAAQQIYNIVNQLQAQYGFNTFQSPAGVNLPTANGSGSLSSVIR